MAVEAKFGADTSSFVKEVDKADAALKRFGGTASTMQKTVGQFDSALQQVGINVGPAAKAIDEIANAAGKSALSLGLMGTAGVVLATGMAAWKITRMIAEFIGLDEAVAHATTTLLGWKDANIEAALAQNDVQMKAIKLGADLFISYADAIKFVAEKEKERLAGLREAEAAAKKQGEAWKELRSVGNDYSATLEKMGVYEIEEIKHYLAMGISQGVLATAFGVTASQVKAVEMSMKAADEADKAWLAGMQAAAAEAATYASVVADLNTRVIATSDAEKKAVEGLTMKTDAVAATIIANAKARESETQLYTATDVLTVAWMKMQTQLATLDAQKKGDVDITASQKKIYDEFAAVQLKEAEAADAATQAFWKARDALKAKTEQTKEATKETGVYMQQLHMLVDDPKLAAFFGSNAKGAVATTLYSGGQAGITPEMAAAMAAGQFINTAGVGAVHINISQPLGTPQAIAQAVSGALTPSVMQGRKMAGT